MKELLRLLRSAADTLEPFSRQIRANTRVWDGEKYAPPKKFQEPDPYALMWFATLRTAGKLLERQNDVTDAQLDYLRDMFRGSMGTLLDFSLDKHQWGKEAEDANHKLHFIAVELLEHIDSITRSRRAAQQV